MASETIIIIDEENLELTIEDQDEQTVNIEDPEAVVVEITDAGPKGDEGPPGYNFRGDWDNATPYTKNDGSRYSDISWICLIDNTSQAPFVGSTFWAVFADQGPPGATGPTGPTGPAGADGTDGFSVHTGTGVPSNGLGVDGDSYIDDDARILYAGKASGDWANATQIPLAANPNGARLTTSGSTQNPNASTAIAVEWQNQARADSGIVHSTLTNPSRIAPATDKGGRYEIFAAINFNNPSASRINLNLWLRKNGTGTALKSEGQTFGGYSRNSGSSVTSTTFFHWEGDLLDSDYVELMSEEGDIAGTVSIMDDSFINFKQTTLLENQTAGSSYSPGTWTDITLNTGWIDSAGNAQYRKDSEGRVFLRGWIVRTSGVNNEAFIMPSGARPPSFYHYFILPNNTAAAAAFCYVRDDTGAAIISGFVNGDYISLNQIQYDT